MARSPKAYVALWMMALVIIITITMSMGGREGSCTYCDGNQGCVELSEYRY